jgi:hypothetical protein
LTLSYFLLNNPDIEVLAMSDGPHRSLDMRSGWKRVAERGDKRAYTAEEISRAIIPALEQDCRTELQPGFIDRVYKAFRDHESALFKDGLGQQLEGLRDMAGSGIGRSLLEHSLLIAERGGTGRSGMQEALKGALHERAAKGARQVEEHFCRESNSPRAQNVRERIEEGIRGADIGGLTRQILDADSPSMRRPLRQEGLDDGVTF